MADPLFRPFSRQVRGEPADPLLRPFWITVHGITGTFRAHEVDATDTGVMFVNTLPGDEGRTIVGQFPLAMVDAWGEGPPPSRRQRAA